MAQRDDAKTWAATILPKALADAWEDPDALHALIVAAMDLRLYSAVEAAVARLIEHEPTSERARIAAAALSLGLGNHRVARRQLEGVLRAFPSSATARANLSQLDEIEKDSRAALENAQTAVELAPNDASVFAWWRALVFRRLPAELGARLTALAAKEGAWLPRLTLAEMLVADGATERALHAYQDAFATAHMSAKAAEALIDSMAQRGLTREIAAVLGPAWERYLQDPATALIIGRSWLARHEPDKVALVVATLTGDERADELRRALAETRGGEAEARIVSIDGPIWLAGLGSPSWLARRRPAAGARQTVGLLAWAVPSDVPSGSVASRAIPLALAESLWARTDVAPLSLIPVVEGKGLVRWTEPPSLEAVASYCRDLPTTATAIAGTLRRDSDGLVATVNILRAASGLEEARELRADTLPRLVTLLEDTVVSVLVSAGLARQFAEPTHLLAAERSELYLASLDSVAIQLFASQGLIDADVVVNEAFGPRQLARLADASGDIDSPYLLTATAMLAVARRRPALCKMYAEALDRSARLRFLTGAAPAPGDFTADDRAWLERVRQLRD